MIYIYIYIEVKATGRLHFVCDIYISNFCLTVDGRWTLWSEYGLCTIECSEHGKRIRYRTCTDPSPSCGGEDCVGDNSQSIPCETKEDCPGKTLYSKEL